LPRRPGARYAPRCPRPGSLRAALPRRLIALTALALAVLGLAACGGDGGEDEYGEEFRRLSERIVSLGEDVGETIETAAQSSDRELAGEFDAFAEELGELRREVDELEPPDDLADEQEELTAAMGQVRASLEDIAGAAERSDPQAARQATIELIEQSDELRDARRALSRAVREQN
jgi:hypothetical protein